MQSIKCHFLSSSHRLQRSNAMSNCKMATSLIVFICLLFAVNHLVLLTQAANVALWKPVEANKTCGSPAEEYYPVSQRQESPRDRTSFTCNALITRESHNATNLVDGNFSSWWQSSASVDKASITIDLGRREKVRSITITYNGTLFFARAPSNLTTTFLKNMLLSLRI